jgi:hypothetical protein
MIIIIKIILLINPNNTSVFSEIRRLGTEAGAGFVRHSWEKSG